MAPTSTGSSVAEAACSERLSAADDPEPAEPILGWKDSASSTSAEDSERAARSATPIRESSDTYGQPDATSDTHRDTCSAVSRRDRVSGVSWIMGSPSWHGTGRASDQRDRSRGGLGY